MPVRERNAARLVFVTITLAALVANACRLGPGGLNTPATATASRVPATLTISPTLAGSSAVLNDLVGNVQVRPAGGSKDLPAINGQTLSEGSQVHTAAGAKAKIRLSDGTILRLRPDTLVTLERLSSDPKNPVTRLLLALGKVFVILKSGQLEVQSPVGVASVTGSFLSAGYQADSNTMLVTCLEGNCTLRNDQAGTALTTGQAASLSGGAGASPVLRWMTTDEIQAWLDDNPEAQAVAPAALTALPTATGTETQTPTATDTATPTATAPAPTDTPTATATRKPRATFTLTPIPPSLTPVPPSATATPTNPRPTSTNPPPKSSSTIGVTIAFQPLSYSFQSLCGDPAQVNSPGTYHVTINGPQATKFDVAPQQTVNGQLPPGQYVIAWVSDSGLANQINYNSDQGPYSMTFCGKP